MKYVIEYEQVKNAINSTKKDNEYIDVYIAYLKDSNSNVLSVGTGSTVEQSIHQIIENSTITRLSIDDDYIKDNYKTISNMALELNLSRQTIHTYKKNGIKLSGAYKSGLIEVVEIK